MTKQRIQLYASPEMKQRIEMAAARRNVPVAEYCLSAIEQQMADDDIVETRNPVLSVEPGLDMQFIAHLEALQERIKRRRNGQPVDIDRAISEMRDERDDELRGLC